MIIPIVANIIIIIIILYDNVSYGSMSADVVDFPLPAPMVSGNPGLQPDDWAVSIHGDTKWLVSKGQKTLQMDDDWGYPYGHGNPPGLFPTEKSQRFH